MTARCIYREENQNAHLEIWQEGELRSLWFDDVILQSEIHLGDPAVLPNPVNRAMLAHLMFDRPLRRVMLAGCGGGAIARWLHARVPEVAGEAVELSPVVARLAREYFDFPPPDSNWRLIVDDVRMFVADGDPHYDYILVDLEENQRTPAWVTDITFLGHCHARLADQGILVLNLIAGEVGAISAALLQIRRVFGAGLLLVNNPQHENLLVLAFRDATTPSTPPRQRLLELGRRWGIDFVTLAGQITHLPA